MNRRLHNNTRGGTTQRRRSARPVWALLGALALAGAAGVGLYKGWRWFLSAPRFMVQTIQFQGQERSSTDELSRRAGLSVGRHMLSFDLAVSAAALETAPWVRSASIVRQWPHTLVVRLTEYHPTALVMAGGLYALDEQGQAFKRLEAGDGLDLPVVTGLSREQLTPGNDAGTLAAAVEIISQWRRAGLEDRAPLAELHVDLSAGQPDWTLYGGDEPVQVRLGTLNQGIFPGQGEAADTPVALLSRLALVWDELEKRGTRPRRIDLGNRQRPEWVAAHVD